MGIVLTLLIGLLAGAFAKYLMPGEEDLGWIKTLGLGLVGAFVGRGVGSILGINVTGGFDFSSILFSTIGSLIVLYVYNRFIKKA